MTSAVGLSLITLVYTIIGGIVYYYLHNSLNELKSKNIALVEERERLQEEALKDLDYIIAEKEQFQNSEENNNGNNTKAGGDSDKLIQEILDNNYISQENIKTLKEFSKNIIEFKKSTMLKLHKVIGKFEDSDNYNEKILIKLESNYESLLSEIKKTEEEIYKTNYNLTETIKSYVAAITTQLNSKSKAAEDGSILTNSKLIEINENLTKINKRNQFVQNLDQTFKNIENHFPNNKNFLDLEAKFGKKLSFEKLYDTYFDEFSIKVFDEKVYKKSNLLFYVTLVDHSSIGAYLSIPFPYRGSFKDFTDMNCFIFYQNKTNLEFVNPRQNSTRHFKVTANNFFIFGNSGNSDGIWIDSTREEMALNFGSKTEEFETDNIKIFGPNGYLLSFRNFKVFQLKFLD